MLSLYPEEGINVGFALFEVLGIIILRFSAIQYFETGLYPLVDVLQSFFFFCCSRNEWKYFCDLQFHRLSSTAHRILLSWKQKERM